MDLCSLPEIRALLSEHGFHFSKSKGQNFLIQRWVVEQVAQCAELDSGCGVIEIGPGIGPLTEQLCQKAGKVVSIEVDRALEPILAETMASCDNLELLWGDAMKMDLKALVESRFGGLRPVACANLPYYITTPVLTALLEAECFEMISVLIQKEAAERICTPAGSPEYCAFSVLCQYYAEPEICCDVPASCFFPQPKVTSAVLTLRTRREPPAPVDDPAIFFRTLKAAFAQRRKTLLNALSSGFSDLGKPALEQCIRAAGFEPGIRGETLDVTEFCALSNEIARCRRNGHV